MQVAAKLLTEENMIMLVDLDFSIKDPKQRAWFEKK
jgi:hypothetical protein